MTRNTGGAAPGNAIGLSLGMVLRRARAVSPAKEIRYADWRGDWHGVPWEVFNRRVHQLIAALDGLGVREGEAVATFAWNSASHFEWFFGVPMAGAVLVPVNARFTDEQIRWVAADARPRVMAVGASLTGRLAGLLPGLGSVRRFVVLEDGGEVDPAFAAAADYEDYEPLLGGAGSGGAAGAGEVPDVAEDRAACVFYTSGTSGNPKGAVYSHRCLVLHTLAVCAADAFAVAERDVVLPLTPLFHAAAWGLPYAAAMTGAGLVFAGPHLEPRAIAGALDRERVTLGAGVPVFWLALEEWLSRDHDGQASGPGTAPLASLERIICGGSAIPAGLVRRYADRGVTMLQGLGMTENVALVALSGVRDGVDPDVAHHTQGLAVPGVELRLAGEDGRILPNDGIARGELEVRSLWGPVRYLGPGAAGGEPGGEPAFRDGWLRSGDIATIDADGYVRLVDRRKDLIKSGGEWISSIAVEAALGRHPDVRSVAVVAVPDDRWQERPLAVVVAREGSAPTAERLTAFLLAALPKWHIPDRYEFVADIPLTATGKFDKKALRARYSA